MPLNSTPPREPLRPATSRLVDLWTAASAPAHNLHKASKTKQKRTNDVLPKPDKSECY